MEYIYIYIHTHTHTHTTPLHVQDVTQGLLDHTLILCEMQSHPG